MVCWGTSAVWEPGPYDIKSLSSAVWHILMGKISSVARWPKTAWSPHRHSKDTDYGGALWDLSALWIASSVQVYYKGGTSASAELMGPNVTFVSNRKKKKKRKKNKWTRKNRKRNFLTRPGSWHSPATSWLGLFPAVDFDVPICKIRHRKKEYVKRPPE